VYIDLIIKGPLCRRHFLQPEPFGIPQYRIQPESITVTQWTKGRQQKEVSKYICVYEPRRQS